MKTKNLILLLFIFSIGSQLASSQSKTDDLPVFDLSKEYPQKRLCIQDIAEIEYIPLETTDDILISDRGVLSAVSDKYILIHEIQRGDIFVFDRTGKLYSHFNHKGGSGQEYAWIKSGTILDEKNEEIYVCSQVIQVYSLKGEYKRTLKINTFENDMNIFNFNDTSLLIYDETIIEPRRASKTKKEPYRLVSKKDGSLISVLDIYLSKRYSNKIAEKNGNSWRPITLYYHCNSHFGENLMIADISCDTMYILTPNKGLIPIMTRTPSVHAPEPRTIWATNLTTDKFIFFSKILLYFKPGGPRIPGFIYEFNTGQIYSALIFDSEFDTRPWSNKGAWGPNASPAIAKNQAAEMLQPSSIINAYKGKRLKGNGNKIAKTLQEDDNPVIRIIKFK